MGEEFINFISVLSSVAGGGDAHSALRHRRYAHSGECLPVNLSSGAGVRVSRTCNTPKDTPRAEAHIILNFEF